MNQQTNGGQWNLLGTFTFAHGQNHRVELTDQATGNVIADAVKLVPAPNVTNKATWTPTISTSDSYLVYTRWTSHSNRATDATYTVYHAGGTSTVTVNQQINGGEWQLLGTYNLDPASNHRVELSDDANGTVVADAIYVVPANAAQNSVTWTPTLTQSDLVDVYAKWVDGADRSDAVTYTVYHAGGSTAVNMNQKQNGTVWNWLGRFTLNPSSNHRVEVTDSVDGVVVADAVRFVSVTSSGAGLMYVHSDHLRTPQKMTDGNQALVWDAVFEPFGEVHSITGTASNNQRFPGQYADAESGFSYNYFRDYDPTIGRYVESDPIGLGGGPNAYVYVGNHPLNFLDPYGLLRWPEDIYDEAVAGTNSNFPNRADRWNGPGDAYRHCLASCMMTRENGRTASEALGWVNEKKGDWTRNQNPKERAMDDWNNACGNVIGETAQSDQGCQNKCMKALQDGTLRYGTGGEPFSGAGYWGY